MKSELPQQGMSPNNKKKKKKNKKSFAVATSLSFVTSGAHNKWKRTQSLRAHKFICSQLKDVQLL